MRPLALAVCNPTSWNLALADGSLPLGMCTLHSDDMLKGGFNCLMLGLALDVLLEWRHELEELVQDRRLLGWLRMVWVFVCV